MAIHLTKEEKARRYDSLQTAFKYTKETYQQRRTDAASDYERYGANNILGSYSRGIMLCYDLFLEDLERWIE